MLVSAEYGILHPYLAILVQRMGQKRGGCTGWGEVRRSSAPGPGERVWAAAETGYTEEE